MTYAFAANVAAAKVRACYTDGPSCAKPAARETTTGERMTMREMMHSPFENALRIGRLHEREDILKYLMALAVTTENEELWEAIDYIKDSKHA